MGTWGFKPIPRPESQVLRQARGCASTLESTGMPGEQEATALLFSSLR